MWLKKIKKKKVQYLLIAFIFMFISAIFSGSLIFALGIHDFTNTYYSSEHSPEYYFALSGEEGKKALEEYDKEKEVFKELYFQKGKIYKGNLSVGKKTFALLQSDFFALENTEDIPFHFKGDKHIQSLKRPEKGTVWISAVFADANHLKAGDNISLKGEKKHTFKVAGTYQSSITPSSSMAFYPFYIHPDDLNTLSDLSDGYYGCFQRMDRAEDIGEFLKTLPSEFNKSMEVQYSLEMLKISVSMVVMLIAAIGLMSAVVVFFVSLIIIRFILKSSLVKEYKSIGIYKAMGFQNREIRGFYLKGYAVTGGISICVGSLLGIPFGNMIGKFSVKYLSGYEISPSLYWFVLYSSLALISTLILNVYLALRKINSMNPVNALTMEMCSSKTKLKKALIPNAHSSFAMAVNEIFKRKSNSFMIVLILTVAFYLSLLFSMIGYSCMEIPNNSPAWFAVPDTGCFVNGTISPEIESKIQNSRYVKKAVYGSFYILPEIKSKDSDVDLTNCSVFSYNEFPRDVTKIQYKKGREPRGKQEIALSAMIQKEMNISVGDYVPLTINGVEREYFICGQYQSMMNGGMSMQITNEALDACSTAYENTIAFVKLKDNADYQNFKKEMERSFHSVNVTKKLDALTDVSTSVTDIVVPISSILVIIFICFSFLNIINMLLMNNIDHRKRFGILKALGFTNGYIIRQNLYHILLLSGTSILLSVCIHIGFSAKLFEAMVGVDGYVNHPFFITALLTGMLCLIVLTSLAFAVTIRKISPTDLMEE